VIPHWPLDEVDAALRRCVASFPAECERVVVVNDGTGYGRNVNRVLEQVGLLDERFERAYWEDDDLLARLHAAGVPTRQVASVRVRHVGGLSTVKLPEHRQWLELNAQRFQEKWGSLPPPKPRYRRARGEDAWHFCQNCRGGRRPTTKRRRAPGRGRLCVLLTRNPPNEVRRHPYDCGPCAGA